MALAINTNISSLKAQNSLNKSTNVLATTFERLSSGLRINSAKDDSAGLSIATRMTSQVRGTNQAIRNANDAISFVQVAEGALDETTNALQRMRELSLQASNGTLTSTDRLDIQDEVDQLVLEVQRIAQNTKFNSQVVLNGSLATGRTFQVGNDANQTIQLSIQCTSISALAIANMSMGGASTTASAAQACAQSAILALDGALGSIADIRSNLGAYQNRFEAVIANLTNVSENTEAAKSQIMDADIAAETANLTKHAILQQASVAILAQANQQPQIAMQLLG